MSTLQERRIAGVPEAYIERVQQLFGLYDSDDERFEDAAKELLNEYTDQENGIVRELLARWFFMNRRSEDAVRLLSEMQEEKNARYPAYMVDAQMCLDYLGEFERTVKLCDQVPFGNPHHLSAMIMKATALERMGEVQAPMEELRQNIEQYRNLKPQPDYLSLLINTLSFMVSTGFMEEHDQLVQELIDYIGTHDLEDPEFFMHDISGYSVTVNEHAWPRESFKRIANAAEEKGWLNENPSFVSGMYTSVESYDAWEDNRINRPLCNLFQWLTSDERAADEEWPVKWSAVTAYESDPHGLEYIKEHYPNLTRVYLPEVLEVLEHGKAVKKQAEEWVMKHDNLKSREEARNYLRGFMEYTSAPATSADFVPEEFGISCPEEAETPVRQLLAMYFLDGYEVAGNVAAEIRNEIGDDSGFLRYIEIMSMCALGKGKQALKQIELIKKESPDEFLTVSMEASALRAIKGYRKAEKAYARAEAPYEDQIHFTEGYLDVLGRLGKEHQVRSIVCDILDDIDFYEEDLPINVIDKAFYYAGHVLLIMDDIRNDRTEYLETDTKALKELLLYCRPSGYVENEFARYITNLCQVVMDHPNYVTYFRDLLAFMEKCRTFTVQDMIIQSGYGACESCLIEQETGLEETLILELTHFLHEKRAQEEMDLDLEMKIKESLWYVSEALRNDPHAAEELFERYPHYMIPAKPYLEEILADPEAVKKETEQYLSELTQRSETEMREMLNESYRQFQEEAESERPLLS